MESSSVWKDTDDSVADIIPHLDPATATNDGDEENGTNSDDKDMFYVSGNQFDQLSQDDLILKNLASAKIADKDDTNNDFYNSQIVNTGEEELMNDNLILKASSAKPTLVSSFKIEHPEDDGLYKSSTFGGSVNSGIVLNDDEKIFDYVGFHDSRSYIKFKYKDIPKFLNLIFNRVNSTTSSNNKDSLIPATIVFHMLRYAFYKKHNVNLGNDFFELFVNRVYLIIQDDISGNLITPTSDNTNFGDADDEADDDDDVCTGMNTANSTQKVEKHSKKTLIKNKVKKKNDIVLIAYWISVINFLYYFLLRQEGFFRSHPAFLKKLIALFNDLSNEFVNGVTNRLSDILDESLIDYTSIPNLKEKLIFQSDWNFFKKEGATSNSNNMDKDHEHSFQTILDSLYPPNLIEQSRASPMKILQVLEAIIYVFKLYNINSIILKNLLSRVFSWMNNTIFNRILLNKNKKGKNYLTRSFAIQLRLNLSVIEDWIRSISKSLQDEELELNGKSNEDYFLNDEMSGIKSIIHNFPDDLVDFQIDLGNVTHFDTSSMFYSKSEYEKKKEIKRQEKEKKLKEKEIKRQEKEIKRQEKERKLKEKESKDAKESEEIKKLKVKKETEGEEKTIQKDSKAIVGERLKGGISVKPEDAREKISSRDSKKEEVDNTKSEEDIEEDESEDESEEEDEKFEGKVDVDSTSLICLSNFYYYSLSKIFKYHFQVLYNLLEFLQVFTTVIDSLEKSVESRRSKSSKTHKEIEKEVNDTVLEFLDDDFGYLNYAQIYYVCKNYKYELDEPKIGKKVQKFLSNLNKINPVNAKNIRLKSIHYSIINDIKFVFLDNLFGRQIPICLPTRKELINKFGPGWRGDNKENMLKFQPYLSLQVRDMIDLIHDQMDYKAFNEEEEEDDNDDDNQLFHSGTAGFALNDNDDFTQIRKPQDMVNSTNPNTYQFESSFYNNNDILNKESSFQSNAATFDAAVSNEIENTMRKPQSVAAKAWENNFSETSNNKDVDFDFNPW